MTITFPELTETEGRLSAKRKELADIFAEAKTDGGELDVKRVKSLGDGADVVEHIRQLNAELDDLAVKREGLLAVAKAAKAAESFGEAAEAAESGAGDTPDTKGHRSLYDAVKAANMLTKGAKGEVDFDVKTLFETTAGWAPEVLRGPRLVDIVTAPTNILNLIPRTTTAQSAIKFMQEKTYTNNAAETAEGASKPEAALEVEDKLVPVAKIAVTLPVTDEQFEDEPRAAQYVFGRLERMVLERLANQVVVGDGIAPNIEGVLNVSGIQTQAKGSDPTPDAVYKAMVKVMTTGGAFPDAYVTNPLDWQDVRLLRTTDGVYIWGNPSDAGPDRIWGLQVALVQQLTQNTGLVGDFGGFTELAIRKGIAVDLGYVNDQFKKNQQTVRAEMRAAFLVYRPTAFCSVTGI